MTMEFSIVEGGLAFPLPKWRRVAQSFEAPRVESIPQAIAREMRKLDGRVRPGTSVAVGVGSKLSRLVLSLLLLSFALKPYGVGVFVGFGVEVASAFRTSNEMRAQGMVEST